MTPSTRRDALKVLVELSDLTPDVRLGQLLAHVGAVGEERTGQSLWNLDDDQLLATLRHCKEEIAPKTLTMPALRPEDIHRSGSKGKAK